MKDNHTKTAIYIVFMIFINFTIPQGLYFLCRLQTSAHNAAQINFNFLLALLPFTLFFATVLKQGSKNVSEMLKYLLFILPVTELGLLSGFGLLEMLSWWL